MIGGCAGTPLLTRSFQEWAIIASRDAGDKNATFPCNSARGGDGDKCLRCDLHPDQAAPLPAPGVTTGSGTIEQVRERHGHGGYGHHRGHGGGHYHGGGGHYYGGHHHGHHGFNNFGVFPGFAFSFGFPQAYYQPYYQPYYGYGDCFRTWDGQLICR